MNTNKRRTQVCSLLCPLIFWAPLLEYTYFSLCKNRKQSKMWFSFPDQFFFYLIYLIMNLCALLSTREYWIKPLRHAWPFHSQDLISNSPYCLLYSSCGVSSENLVLDQLIIPWLIFFCILITCILDHIKAVTIFLIFIKFTILLYWWCKEKFCLGHSWVKGIKRQNGETTSLLVNFREYVS